MLDFNRFEVVTFDCYGTLINWENGILNYMRRLLAAHGKAADDANILQLYGDFEAAAEHGAYRPYRDVLQTVVGDFGKYFGFAPNPSEIASLPNSLPGWEPWPDTVGALRDLSRRYRLAIISNVDDDLFAGTLPSLKVKFAEIITAQQAGAYKPSLKMFELALKRLGRSGFSPDRILHVGQSIYHDVIPAQSLGMTSVWVNRPSPRSGVGAVKQAEGHPDLEVSSLDNLVSAIERAP